MASRPLLREETHQARKARATRERILDAVVQLINEGGYGAATSSAIAKRAGITWGAVQHHFGNKDEIMIAVMERAGEVYLASLDNPLLRRDSVEERIERFIDLVWEHYKSDLYIAFTEIVMASRDANSGLAAGSARMNRQVEKSLPVLNTVFEGCRVPHAELRQTLRFVHRFLAGFALDRIYDPRRPFERRHLDRLKRELLSLVNAH